MTNTELPGMEPGVDDGDACAYITICRDIPGDHTGGPGCFCCPGTFRADDSEGIDLFMTTTQYGN